MKKMTGCAARAADKRLAVRSRLEEWILSSDSSGLLCGAETSNFWPILADFQCFLAKIWQFLNCLTRKKRSDFVGTFFTEGFGFPRTP